MKDSIDHFTGEECLNLAAVQNERAGGRQARRGGADRPDHHARGQAKSALDPEEGRVKKRVVIVVVT